jgi:hypothetical protein
LTTEDSTSQDYNALLAQLKTQNIVIPDKLVYDTINFRALTAELDNCDVEKLLENPTISTISLNAQGTMELRGNNSDVKVSERDDIKPEQDHNITINTSKNLNATIFERNIPAASANLFLAGGLVEDGDQIAESPFHLAWLTATWAQRGLAGQGTCM